MTGAVSLELVRDMVSTHRRAGNKIEVAFMDAAEALGVSPRWVRSVIRGEPAVIKPSRIASLQARFAAWLAADIAKTESLIAERKMLLAKMENSDAAALAAGQGDLFLARAETVVATVKRGRV
jgi:hypothetical protein